MSKDYILFNLIKTQNILGVDFFVGSLTLNEIKEIKKVPIYKAWKPLAEGYQRAENQKRIDQIRDRVLRDPDSLDIFVDAVNLNIRVPDAAAHIEPIDKSSNGYGSFHTFKYIDTYGPAWVVDGQHRILGALAALEKADGQGDSDIAEKIGNSRINISLTLTNDVYKEAYVFYLINRYAKSVSPDGAHRLIVEGHNSGDLNFYNEVTSGKSMSEDDIKAANIADKLAADSGVWSTRVKDFNESGAGLVSIRALTLMLHPVFTAVKNQLKGTSSRLDPEVKTYEIIEAYWEALSIIFKDNIFNPMTQKEYGMMKSSQAEVMFKILTNVIKFHTADWVEKFGAKPIGDLSDAKTFVKLLEKPLTATQDRNALDKKVTGASCWYVGKTGAMGMYTSSAAKKDVAEKITREIEASHGIHRSEFA